MSAYTSKHIIEFEHLYKKGQTVWFLGGVGADNDKANSGKVEIVEFNPDNGSVCYFIKERGWFEEEDLFDSEKKLKQRTIKRIQTQIADARAEETLLQRRLNTNKEHIKKLELSPWLAKETNCEK